MSQMAVQKELQISVDSAVEKVTAVLKDIGFGVLTRIDLDQKIQEKLGQRIAKTVILGACNPEIALEAFRQTTDVALLIPCNVVVRETSAGNCIVEVMRPSQMLNFLEKVQLSDKILKSEKDLERVIHSLN